MSLYQHQRDGAAWLAARSRGYLGDVPGLGKTRTLLDALHHTDARRALIVCPAIVRTHWSREIVAVAAGRGVRYEGGALIKSYDEITRGGNALMKTLIRDEKIDALVLDEAHYLKHAGSKRTLQLLGPNGYARRLPRVYCASGTPVPKNPAELWTTLASLFPEVAVEHRLTTYDTFVGRFCYTDRRLIRGAWHDKIMPHVKNADEFRELLGKIMLRRTLDDVGLDVPALDWQTTRLDVAPNYDEWTADELEGLAHLRHEINTEALDLASIAADPHVARMRRRLGELKVSPAATLINDQMADSDEKVVVFAHHRSVLAGLRALIWDDCDAYVDGDTTSAQRDDAIDRFQNDPNCRVFLGQNIACQTGITLTAARRVFLVEPDWTAVVNQQLGHRVARIGQMADCCIAHMICLAGTLDEAVINQNSRELQLADRIGLGAI